MRVDRHCEGTIVKRYALATALAFLAGGAVQAAVIDLGDSQRTGAQVAAGPAAERYQMAVLPDAMSELPEPEVFAMMLVGLVLIGYRASRDSSEKFE
jgi:hypothetical protein